MKSLLLCLLVLVSSGCVDKGRCLEQHTQLVLVPQYMTTCSNNVCSMRLMYFMPVNTVVCDRYEFPDGRPE